MRDDRDDLRRWRGAIEHWLALFREELGPKMDRAPREIVQNILQEFDGDAGEARITREIFVLLTVASHYGGLLAMKPERETMARLEAHWRKSEASLARAARARDKKTMALQEIVAAMPNRKRSRLWAEQNRARIREQLLERGAISNGATYPQAGAIVEAVRIADAQQGVRRKPRGKRLPA